MKRSPLRPSRRHETWIYGSFGLLFLSGVVWLIAHFWLHGHGRFGETPSPLAPWAMKVHGAAAMLGLVVLGTLLPGHVSRAWKGRRCRWTGAGLLALSGILIGTGYGLYYFGGEELRAMVSVSHWIVGLALPVMAAVHIHAARRIRSRLSRVGGRAEPTSVSRRRSPPRRVRHVR